jgi:hypothetical protein
MAATVTIGASGVDTAKVISDAEKAVAAKITNGSYASVGLTLDKRINPLEFKNDEDFLAFYLESLHDTAFVDISDFEIEEKRARFRAFFLRLKKGIWGLLKFYTYRLWSQQNQVNGLLLSAIEGLHERHRSEIERLEKRITELEEQLPESPK